MRNLKKLRVASLGVIRFLAAVLVMSVVIHQSLRIEALNAKTRALQVKVERYENYSLFNNAVEVSKITEVPLYQVLTGLSVPNQTEE